MLELDGERQREREREMVLESWLFVYNEYECLLLNHSRHFGMYR